MPYKDTEKQKQAQRESYLRGKAAGKSTNSGRLNNQRRMQELKDNKPCADCGVVYRYYVLHYDHTEDNKVAGVSQLIKRVAWSKVLEEIEKCDLVCANCHAERTQKRMSKQ